MSCGGAYTKVKSPAPPADKPKKEPKPPKPPAGNAKLMTAFLASGVPTATKPELHSLPVLPPLMPGTDRATAPVTVDKKRKRDVVVVADSVEVIDLT